MNQGGVLVVGLDGGTLRVIRPLAERGVMPEFGKIMAGGRIGALRSTIPWYTIPGWTSLMTGVQPGTHGLLNWAAAEPDEYFEDGRRGRRFVASSDIPVPTFWDVAGAAGKRVAVLNMPVTYPAWPVNGSLITGLLTPRAASSGGCYPEDLLERFPGYQVDLSVSRAAESPDAATVEGVHLPSYLQELIDLTQGRARVGGALLAEDVDLGVMVFVGPDRISHKAWYEQAAVADGRSTSGEIEGLIETYYRALDRALGDLIAAAGDGITVMVVADHGFGPPPEASFMVNAWLREAGYLKLRASGTHRMAPWRRAAKRVARPLIRRARRRRVAPSEASLVDWSATSAYAVGYSRTTVFGLVVNRAGLKAHGWVEAEEARALLDRLQGELTSITDEQGRRVVRRIWTREELGVSRPGFPDLMVETDPTFFPSSGTVKTRLFQRFRAPSGFHERDGIFIVSGPAVRGSGEAHAEIVDVAPTVLALLGIAAAEHIEGRVLDDLFDLPELRPAPSDVQGPGGQHRDLAEEELREIEEHLQALGYTD